MASSNWLVRRRSWVGARPRSIEHGRRRRTEMGRARMRPCRRPCLSNPCCANTIHRRGLRLLCRIAISAHCREKPSPENGKAVLSQQQLPAITRAARGLTLRDAFRQEEVANAIAAQ